VCCRCVADVLCVAGVLQMCCSVLQVCCRCVAGVLQCHVHHKPLKLVLRYVTESDCCSDCCRCVAGALQVCCVHTAPYCTTVHHTATISTRCNTLQHTTTHCYILHYTLSQSRAIATHTATHLLTILRHAERHLPHLICKRHNTLQHTATHCNTLQHTCSQSCAMQ